MLPNNSAFQIAAGGIFVLVRLSHTYYSMFQCYGVGAYREVALSQPMRFFGIPFVIILVLTSFFIVPLDWLPYERSDRLRLYAFLVFPLTYWHYSMQHYGIISIYRAKGEQRLTKHHANLEKYYCHLTTTFLVSILTLKNFYDVGFWGISLRKFLYLDHVNWNVLAIVLCLASVAYLFKLEVSTQKFNIPKFLYIISIALMTLTTANQSFLVSFMLIDMQHFLVMFGLGGQMMSSKTSEKQARIDLVKYSLVFMGSSLILSMIYFYFEAHGLRYKHYDVILAGFVSNAKGSVLADLMFGFFIAIGIVHYYYDRLVFRFSDPKIGPIAKRAI